MRMGVARIKGLAFIVWHARHEFYHILLGLIWAWFLREWWQTFNVRWIWISVIGSLLPDLDHFYYFTTYGRGDEYTQEIKQLLKNRQWRALATFIETGHKYQTSLASHNVYFMFVLVGLSVISGLVSWEIGVILFGAMVIHYCFDIADDLLILGALNPNWRRWGRKKVQIQSKRIHESA